jgi:hypothetical protein
MSEFEWKEQQIKKVYESRKHKKSWLDARAIRAGLPAVDVRRLMKIMVDRELAFGNGLTSDNEKYKICFNLEGKDIILEDLDRFDNSLLSDPRIIDLPPKSLLDPTINSQQLDMWNFTKRRYTEVYAAFCRHQNGLNIEDLDIHMTDNEGNIDVFFSNWVKKGITIEARMFINMYKVLKIGWREIKSIFHAPTYNDLFLEILLAHHLHILKDLFRLDGKIEMNPRSQSRYLKELANRNKSIETEIKILIKESNDDQEKDRYRSLLEDCEQHPYGRSFTDAVNALSDVSSISDKFRDIIKAYHAVNKALPITDTEYEYDLALRTIKNLLDTSTDPRVQKALSDWRNSENESFNLQSLLNRRYVEHPKERP